MQLILIRHGHAEIKGTRLKDEDRRMTKKGKEIMKKAAEGLNNFLPKNCKPHIWSSPLPRALESAEILSKVLGIKHIEKFIQIEKGTINELIVELEKLNEEEYLIIVGHGPALSEWSKLICGAELHFKKGAAAGIKLLDTQIPLFGELNWFVQPNILCKLKK